MNKFNIRDEVRNTSDSSRVGCIKSVIERCYNNKDSYLYLVFNVNNKKYFLESEESIKLLKKASEEDYVHESKYTRELEIGDVVAFNSGLPIGEYVVSSDVKSENYNELYKVIPIGNNPYNESCICEKSMLKFIYHDSKWEKIITESYKNIGLAAWRGELYSFMKLTEAEREEYENDTLPPWRMEHILKEHSYYRRMDGLMGTPMKSEIIKRMIGYTEKDVKEIIKSIKRKILYYNGVYSKDGLSSIRKGHDNTVFNVNENKLITVVDYVDKYVNKESKDHYPPYMSDYAIMKAIKEAYENAEKKVEITEKGYGGKPRQVLYQGKSKDGLILNFYYYPEEDIIYSAYPVFIDNTNRPDLRHPTTKDKKRQN